MFADSESKRLYSHIDAIESESGTDGLVNTLKDLVIHLRQGKSDKDGKKRKSIFHKFLEPTTSSQPTGIKWTANALVQNLEHLFKISPQRTNAMKEVLGLPIHQQWTLFGALIER